MRILIANITLSARTGTEIIVSEVARELSGMGHTIAVYAGDIGPIAEQLRPFGIIVTDKISDLRFFDPDIIHAHHSSTYAIAQSAFPRTPCVWFCHDILSWHDEPPNVSQIILYVAYGVTTFNRLVYEGGIAPSNIRLLPNGADSPSVCPSSPPMHLKTALIVAKYHDTHVAALTRACTLLGLSPRVIGDGQNKQSSDMIREYLSSDIVFGSGKVVVEAIAAGRPVFCADERGIAGLVTSDVFGSWRARNFGGSILRHPLDERIIANELKLYSPQDFNNILSENRESLLLSVYVNKLENIYSEALSLALHASAKEADSEIATYLEKILPLGRGRGLSISPIEYEKIRLKAAKYRFEIEMLKLSHHDFTDGAPMSFAEGEAGRATLQGGWDLNNTHVVTSNSPRARIILPSSTNWHRGRIIKLEGLMHATSDLALIENKSLTLFANGIEKCSKNIEINSAAVYTYVWFEITDEVVSNAADGTLIIDLVVKPYVSDAVLGRGFSVSNLWNR